MKKYSAISKKDLLFIKSLYNDKKFTMREISVKLGVSIDAVVAFFRKNKIARRSYKEVQKLRFQNKSLSFSKVRLTTSHLKELCTIGVMLYWAEGYKGTEKNSSVDFANSDPLMIKLFLKFLRKIYRLDEKRLRVYLYCYSDQNIPKLISFWGKVTNISKSQFSKPYIRSDFKKDGRKMEHGMIHVRYNDKKLLLDIKNMIQSYVSKYASVG